MDQLQYRNCQTHNELINKPSLNTNHQKPMLNLPANIFPYLIAIFSILVLTLIILIFQKVPQSNQISQNPPRNLDSSLLRDLKDIPNEDLSLQSSDHQLGADHNHEPYILSYAAVGLPQVGQPFNVRPMCYKEYLEFEQKEDELFKPYKDTDCKLKRFGQGPGNGYYLCHNFIEPNQTLLNFGLTKGDQFGCSLSSNYNMTNYLYICSCGQPNFCQNGAKGKTITSRLCLSEMPETNKDNIFTSISEEIQSKGLKDKKIILKIDVDGAQWMALKTLPLEYLENIQQMVIVFHNPLHPSISPPLQGYLTIIDSLKKHFISVNFHLNNKNCLHHFYQNQGQRKYRSTQLEITLVNKNIIKVKSEERRYANQIKNVVSDLVYVDCQMSENN